MYLYAALYARLMDDGKVVLPRKIRVYKAHLCVERISDALRPAFETTRLKFQGETNVGVDTVLDDMRDPFTWSGMGVAGTRCAWRMELLYNDAWEPVTKFFTTDVAKAFTVEDTVLTDGDEEQASKTRRHPTQTYYILYAHRDRIPGMAVKGPSPQLLTLLPDLGAAARLSHVSDPSPQGPKLPPGRVLTAVHIGDDRTRPTHAPAGMCVMVLADCVYSVTGETIKAGDVVPLTGGYLLPMNEGDRVGVAVMSA
jgi:hypothetical protein